MSSRVSAGPSQADLLLRMATGRYRLTCGPDGRPYATELGGQKPAIAVPLRGPNGLRQALAPASAESSHKSPGGGALSDALMVLEGRARASAPEPIGLRVAEHDQAVELDLGDAAGRAVVLGPLGWQLLDRAPLLFRRTQLTWPLPEPARP